MSKDHEGELGPSDARAYTRPADTKMDDGKLPVMRGAFLRFPRAMREIARVSVLGATKYDSPIGDMGYLNVERGGERYTEALGRHLLDEVTKGLDNVEKGGALPESGMEVLHAAQAAWNALARLEYLMVELEKPPTISKINADLVRVRENSPKPGDVIPVGRDYHVDPRITEFAGVDFPPKPAELSDQACPHGNDWEDCPDCRH